MKPIINLNDFAGGAAAEKFNNEMQRVLDNIADPNTDFKKARKVTLTVTLKANKNRDLANVAVEAKSTIAPSKPISTDLIIDLAADGKVTGAELKSGLVGQMYADENGEVLDDRGEKVQEEKAKATDRKVVNFK
ncbi:replication terminator protein [Sporosarcina sp. P37]|uniref:replication terminator protein n=1 Tax=unclassified Sporosarcina TaxID=2647733 RepID=UPI000A17E368|nr:MULTISPECIES: replication terminator protein [unclassified Sporosarcina]ARK25982.1 replication terminator protein [Sporosarcina sp. P37]PID19352.1 replication terminator protein [Sporosarcina sp. P35]